METHKTNHAKNMKAAPESSELSHARQCLELYLHNTRAIYTAYTVPAINLLTKVCTPGTLPENNIGGICGGVVNAAMQAAARLVRQYDHMAPTAADIEAAKAQYVEYIIETAEYELQNA